MTSSALTIVGGSARAAAQSAVRAGFSPIAGDLFGDEDLRRMCPTTCVDDFPAGLAQVCAGPQPGGWMYTGALENHPQLIARMSQIRPLLGNGADTVRRVRDPFLLAAALQRGGFNTLSLSSTAEGLPRDGSWLRKPFRSAGGADVSFWNTASSASPTSSGFYFQQFAAGEVCGAVYVAGRTDVRLFGVSQQLPATAGSFVYHGSIGPIDLPRSLMQQFEQLGAFVAAEFELVGLFGVDVVIQGDTIWPLEVNPRYTASIELLERSQGIQAIAWHVAACREEPLPTITPPRPAIAGKQILYASRELIVPVQLLELAVQENRDVFSPCYADLPAAGSVIRAGWPILTVLANADNPTSVQQSLHHQTTVVNQILGTGSATV